VFVATTVPLVCQQGKYLKSRLGFSYNDTHKVVGIVTGDLRPEDWDGGKWKEILAKHTVNTF
jgi:ERCC4-related helicase